MNIIIHPEKHNERTNERMNARLSSSRSDDELLSSFVRAVLFFILYIFIHLINTIRMDEVYKMRRKISFDVISDPPFTTNLHLTNNKRNAARRLFNIALFSRDRENAIRVFVFFVVHVAKRRRRRADEDAICDA